MRFHREETLEALCLNTIVVNLGFYSQCELGEKNNKFLRKCYSDKIFQLIRKSEWLEETCTHWLFSPYWNNVTVNQTYSISSLMPKFISYGKEITSVSFEKSLATVEVLSAVVCHLPHIKSLNLKETSCTDDLLLLIRKMCPELENLNLYYCNVTDEGMKNLCYVNGNQVGFSSLKVIDIEKTHVKSKGIEYILAHLNLHTIKYPEVAIILYQFFSSNYATNSKIHDLREFKYKLSLNSVHPMTIFRRVLEAWVACCPNVEKLNLCDSNMSKSDADLCLKFQNVKKLRYYDSFFRTKNPTKYEDLAYFLEMRGEMLTELKLENVSISVELIARVCPNLQKLTLMNIDYQNFDDTLQFNEPYQLNSLIKLSIRNSYVDESTANKSIHFLLSISKNVQSVSLHIIKNLTDALIDSLITMKHLVKVKFVTTDIKEAAASKLFSCKNITKLYFYSGCPFLSVKKFVDKFCSGVESDFRSTVSWQVEDYVDRKMPTTGSYWMGQTYYL